MKFNYGIDIAPVKKIVPDSVQSSEHILPDPTARLGVAALEPDRYTISLNVWVNAHGFYDTRILLQEEIIVDLKAAGIKLP